MCFEPAHCKRLHYFFIKTSCTFWAEIIRETIRHPKGGSEKNCWARRGSSENLYISKPTRHPMPRFLCSFLNNSRSQSKVKKMPHNSLHSAQAGSVVHCKLFFWQSGNHWLFAIIKNPPQQLSCHWETLRTQQNLALPTYFIAIFAMLTHFSSDMNVPQNPPQPKPNTHETNQSPPCMNSLSSSLTQTQAPWLYLKGINP